MLAFRGTGEELPLEEAAQAIRRQGLVPACFHDGHSSLSYDVESPDKEARDEEAPASLDALADAAATEGWQAVHERVYGTRNFSPEATLLAQYLAGSAFTGLCEHNNIDWAAPELFERLTRRLDAAALERLVWQAEETLFRPTRGGRTQAIDLVLAGFTREQYARSIGPPGERNRALKDDDSFRETLRAYDRLRGEGVAVWVAHPLKVPRVADEEGDRASALAYLGGAPDPEPSIALCQRYGVAGSNPSMTTGANRLLARYAHEHHFHLIGEGDTHTCRPGEAATWYDPRGIDTFDEFWHDRVLPGETIVTVLPGHVKTFGYQLDRVIINEVRVGAQHAIRTGQTPLGHEGYRTFMEEWGVPAALAEGLAAAYSKGALGKAGIRALVWGASYAMAAAYLADQGLKTWEMERGLQRGAPRGPPTGLYGLRNVLPARQAA